MAVIIGAAIAGTAAVAGGAMSANGAKNAANAQQKASRSTVAESARQYDLSRADQEPWRKFGQTSLGNLTNPLANFQASPDYQFRLSRGLEGVTQNKAVAGLLKSGSALKGLNDYAGASAAQEYGDWYNRQLAGAGMGQTANAANQQAGQAYAQSVGQANQANALAQMQSSYNQAGAWGQALGQVGGIAANAITNFQQPNYGSLNSAQSSMYRGFR
jgi:hypothetical protein